MIISYAQNFEDIMLWRALKHVDGGFYIDVGANDPNVESVTRLFYEHGWTGINIEPVEQWFDKLEKARIRDINLKLAVGASSGEITLYDVPDTGLSTIDKATAERHERDKGYKKCAFRTEIRTLTEICESYCRSEIHFLKIDVELAELQVIQGMNFEKYRPWIVVVEATLPNLQTEDYTAWEPLLLESDYRLVYRDGLNRFYVSNEKYEELRGCFENPPNVFDEFVLDDVVNARLDAEKAEKKASIESEKVLSLFDELSNTRKDLATERELTNQLRESNNQLEEWNHQLRESIRLLQLLDETKSNELSVLRKSLSWRITSPLRLLARPLMENGGPRFTTWKKPFESMIIWAMEKPSLVRGVHWIVDFVPPLRKAVTSRVALILDGSADSYSFDPNIHEMKLQLIDDFLLTPHAKRIQRDIEAAIDRVSVNKS
jgi:FkbM family methyltransferase